jgi:hypothetical protein
VAICAAANCVDEVAAKSHALAILSPQIELYPLGLSDAEALSDPAVAVFVVVVRPHAHDCHTDNRQQEATDEKQTDSGSPHPPTSISVATLYHNPAAIDQLGFCECQLAESVAQKRV